jgi:hypothetical protein
MATKSRAKPRAVAPAFSLTEEPCERCLELARDRQIRVETVQRLPAAPWTPLAQDRSGPCCFDCASADALMRLNPGAYTFTMARIAVGNDRQEQYRLPGAPMGLVGIRIVRPSVKGDLEDQHAWLDRMHWFYIDEET